MKICRNCVDLNAANSGFQVSAEARIASGARVAAAIKPAIQTSSSNGEGVRAKNMAEQCLDSQNQEMILFNDLPARDHPQCQVIGQDNG